MTNFTLKLKVEAWSFISAEHLSRIETWTTQVLFNNEMGFEQSVPVPLDTPISFGIDGNIVDDWIFWISGIGISRMIHMPGPTPVRDGATYIVDLTQKSVAEPTPTKGFSWAQVIGIAAAFGLLMLMSRSKK